MSTPGMWSRYLLYWSTTSSSSVHMRKVTKTFATFCCTSCFRPSKVQSEGSPSVMTSRMTSVSDEWPFGCQEPSRMGRSRSASGVRPPGLRPMNNASTCCFVCTSCQVGSLRNCTWKPSVWSTTSSMCASLMSVVRSSSQRVCGFMWFSGFATQFIEPESSATTTTSVPAMDIRSVTISSGRSSSCCMWCRRSATVSWGAISLGCTMPTTSPGLGVTCAMGSEGGAVAFTTTASA
mmetsp:Transcript_7294/g.21544  ORF Transcript_7294/g.21544 Transcript_7294/m.21544 type:complete len:235 (-) Transcript_7294:1315-2019(-)